MLSDFGLALSAVWDFMGLEFTLYGFTFSFREIMLWSIVAGLLLVFIGGFFHGD